MTPDSAQSVAPIPYAADGFLSTKKHGLSEAQSAMRVLAEHFGLELAPKLELECGQTAVEVRFDYDQTGGDFTVMARFVDDRWGILYRGRDIDEARVIARRHAPWFY